MTQEKLKIKILGIVLFILTLGTILRLIFIDKPDGLWNDEYVSWMIASIPLGKKFTEAVMSQCHMPFYYFFLKFFIHFFGNSDYMLRLTSVATGALSIISMYFVGKEFKDEKLGILTASICAISSFQIYFSQEVRFYELLFLFSSLSLLYTAKLCKNQTTANILGYIVSNFLIIFTHTIGFVYVLLNLIALSIYILKKNEQPKKMAYTIWISLAILTILNIPLIARIFTHTYMTQWWDHFSIAKLGYLMTDYFSPILTNIVSSPNNFFYNFNLNFAIFALIPTTIAIIGIIKSLNEKPFTIYHLQFIICFSYLIVLIIAALAGKIVFLTKYTMEIYPILILLAAAGLLEFKKGWRYFLIFAFCALNLFYVLTNPNSAPRLHRSEGHKIVADLLKNADIKKGDFILLNYYGKERFEKYFDFKDYNVFSINKSNYSEYFKKNDKLFFRNKFEKNILNKIKSGDKLVIVILNDVAIYTPMQMKLLYDNEREYNNPPLFYVAFSDIKNNALENCMNRLQITRIEQKGSWSTVTFKKQ